MPLLDFGLVSHFGAYGDAVAHRVSQTSLYAAC